MPSNLKMRCRLGADGLAAWCTRQFGAWPARHSRFCAWPAVGARGAVPVSFALLVTCLVSGHPVQARSPSDAAPPVGSNDATDGAVANISTIGPALQRSSGMAVVNQAAGTGNVQQNSAALAHGAGYSVARVHGRQAPQRVVPTVDQLLIVSIDPGAFEDARGVYLVNQSAGAGNSQFNGAAIAVGGVSALGIVQLDDTRLQEHRAGTGAPVLHDEGGAKVSASANLAPDAFAGARGLFLVNQAAGNNNATANTFTLSASP